MMSYLLKILISNNFLTYNSLASDELEFCGLMQYFFLENKPVWQ